MCRSRMGRFGDASIYGAATRKLAAARHRSRMLCATLTRSRASGIRPWTCTQQNCPPDCPPDCPVWGGHLIVQWTVHLFTPKRLSTHCKAIRERGGGNETGSFTCIYTTLETRGATTTSQHMTVRKVPTPVPNGPTNSASH